MIDDIVHDSDVIKIVVDPKHTFVINSHMSSMQIWYSSPVSGPKRFDLHDDVGNVWKDRNGQELFGLLDSDLKLLRDKLGI